MVGIKTLACCGPSPSRSCKLLSGWEKLESPLFLSLFFLQLGNSPQQQEQSIPAWALMTDIHPEGLRYTHTQQ